MSKSAYLYVCLRKRLADVDKIWSLPDDDWWNFGKEILLPLQLWVMSSLLARDSLVLPIEHACLLRVYSCSCTHAHVSMRCYYYNYCCCFLHFRPMPRSECSQCIVIMHVHSRELCMHVHARTCIAENYYREMQLAFHTVYWGWWNGWYDGEVFLLTLSWLVS